MSPRRDGWRVLVVDDDEDDCFLVEDLFREISWQAVEVRCVPNAEEGLDAMTSGPYDVALVDYRLGARSGLDLVREARQAGVGTPILILTGRGSREVDLEAMEAGAQDYLVKSELTASALERSVRYVLERQAHLEEVRRREQKLRLLIEQVPAVMWATDRDLRFTVSMGAGLEKLGLEPNQVVGTTLYEFFETDDPGHPAIAAQRGALKGERVFFSLEHLGRFFECSVEPLRTTNGNLPEGVIGLALDVTEQRQSEKALERRDVILRAVGETAARLLRTGRWTEEIDEVLGLLGEATEVSRVSLFRVGSDEEGKIAASLRREWTGEGIEPMIDDPLLQSVPFEGAFDRWLDRFRDRRSVHGTVDSLPPEERPLLEAQGIQSICVVPIFVEGEVWGFLALDECRTARRWTDAVVGALEAAADVAGSAIQRVRIEGRLREREDELFQAQKMDAMGRLAGGVAHDFNNLLTAIGGYGELLLASLDDESQKADCEEILRAAGRAAELTRQLLSFSRRDTFRPVPLDVDSVVKSTERMLRRLITAQISLELDLSGELPQVDADPGKLEQVLVNLAVNARDAMEGRGRITITTGVLRPDDSPGAGPRVCIAVADTGPGIPAELRDRIFEPFFTTKEEGQGTGLGLSTVYGIVQQLGGTIQVGESEEGGALFEILLPIAGEKDGVRTRDETGSGEFPVKEAGSGARGRSHSGC